MSKIRPGHKWNSYLNGEWATHMKHKRVTSKARRAWDKDVIKEELELPDTKGKAKKVEKPWIVEYYCVRTWCKWFGRFAKREDAIRSGLKQIAWEEDMILRGLNRSIKKMYRVRNVETDEDFYL